MMFVILDQEDDEELIGDIRDDMTEIDGRGDAEAAVKGSVLEDTNLWVLLGFIIVIAILLSQGVGKKLGGMLGSRSKLIQDQLDEARGMREEAQRLLADYQKRQREAEGEAEEIINRAKADAKAMSAEARRKLDESVERRTQAAHDRIARAEAQALADVRAQTADLSVDAAREIIKARTDGSAHKALLDRAIGDIRGKLH